MQAIILAAGLGSRLKHLTENNTKCMVKVCGIPLIERMLHQLDRYNLSRIVLVIGYKGENLKRFISTLPIRTPIEYVTNEIYDKTNNIYSLYLAEKFLVEDSTILLESDLIFEDRVLDALIQDERETLALVDHYKLWMDGTVLTLDETDGITGFLSKKDFDYKDTSRYYKTVNIYKFSRDFSKTHYVPYMKAYLESMGCNEYYEQVLRVITQLDTPIIQAKRLKDEVWYEIDDEQDLDIAESLFAPEEERLKLIESRYGGYWRYPKMLDFCYLVNPFYPPQKLVDEMQASFSQLLRKYPSGMRVNSLVCAKSFGFLESHLIVGNGSSELIRSLMGRLHGKTAFIRPTFEEYPNRNKEEAVEFFPKKEGFSYTADDIIGFLKKEEPKNLILVNPDNPTGNYIPKADMIRLLDEAKSMGIRIVLDESFLDFSEERGSVLTEKFLALYPNLIGMKSISKSFGVPGIRLGYMVSSDEELIREMKKDVSIWNISSLGEFFLQICEKYKKDYWKAMDIYHEIKKEFQSELNTLPHLKVYPTQANYFLCRLEDGRTARDLTEKLFLRHHILIKDLSNKIQGDYKEYIRVAVCTNEENKALIEALREELGAGNPEGEV